LSVGEKIGTASLYYTINDGTFTRIITNNKFVIKESDYLERSLS